MLGLNNAASSMGVLFSLCTEHVCVCVCAKHGINYKLSTIKIAGISV